MARADKNENKNLLSLHSVSDKSGRVRISPVTKGLQGYHGFSLLNEQGSTSERKRCSPSRRKTGNAQGRSVSYIPRVHYSSSWLPSGVMSLSNTFNCLFVSSDTEATPQVRVRIIFSRFCSLYSRSAYRLAIIRPIRSATFSPHTKGLSLPSCCNSNVLRQRHLQNCMI